MAIEKKELEIAKEIDDIGKLIVELIADIKAKKQLSEIMSENIQNLMDAIGGIDQLDDEIKANRKVACATIGYRAGELTDAILG